MEKSQGFTLMTLDEFERWIAREPVARTILTLQQHHTLSPSYRSFDGGNHFALQAGMKRYHVVNNGWADIGQHFTSFPDGRIMTGRSPEQSPACILGQNANALCVEHVGNFDAGRDEMSSQQRTTILRFTAAICRRFAIPLNTDRVVYHHWFNLSTGARTDGSGQTKSCPGTAFFGGNTVANAQGSFLPLVRSAMGGSAIAPSAPEGMRYAAVTVDQLNVRTGPGTRFAKSNSVGLGSVLRVHDEKSGWFRISASKKEWVAARLTQLVERATVNASTLNVRNGPAVTFNKLAAIAKGEEVFVFDHRSGWCRTGLDERWVSEQFLDIA
ncbi:MAG: SH3 domain-containing protein [Gemmatimonadota bacterium]